MATSGVGARLQATCLGQAETIALLPLFGSRTARRALSGARLAVMHGTRASEARGSIKAQACDRRRRRDIARASG